MKNIKKNIGRRKFIGTTSVFATGAVLTGPSLFAGPSILKWNKKPNSLINGVQIGVITYSYRSMPDQSAEALLQYVLDSGISAIEIMGDPVEIFAGKPENSVNNRAFYGLRRAKRNGEELTEDQQKELTEMQAEITAYNILVAQWRRTVSMGKFAELKRMYNDAGVTIYGFKPGAFGKNNSNEEINWGMRAAKVLGATHVTLEHPSDDEHTKKLGEMAKKNNIYVGYHGHEQQTPTLWDTALEQSKYNALNLDLGHYVAAGNEHPLEIIKNKHAHIMSMHIKDRKTPVNGKGNVEWGTGDTPIAEALKLMQKNKYTFPATIEMEYKVPEGSDAVKEVQKCFEYCRHILQ